ncbi:AraC family transcriptional regulator [Neobacillus sp. DY30]|uniref:helix-turn-helix transcriptional regulator n=1 Tax=Neobacillus sp. DY30 TaxID=3047871 RepID=UPI0024BF595A|nr:AraC family transcriptional regulator [Neobacillus sp. DY30]WHY03114.1 AraC family transcriptional regulator [Neobacillus sp. DY30]
MEELISKCWQINKAFQIGVEAIDDQLKTIIHIADDNEPLMIIEARKRMVIDIQSELEQANKDSFYYQNDTFQLSYLAVPMHEDVRYKGTVVVGPFLSERVNDQMIWNVIKHNNLESSWLKPIETYYKTLPILANSYLAIGDLIVNIVRNPHVKAQIIASKNSGGHYRLDVEPQDFDENGFEIIKRYEAEEKLLHYIEIGDKENARKAMLDHHSGDFLYRVPGNPLRARKNITFSGNTMYRIAAGRGGVEPQYLHAISEKFALRIESAVVMSELNTIDVSMVDEYCEAVNNFAIKGYSSVVKKALMYINLHFNESINLQSVADEIGFNRTYLARKFKSETNFSVIDYIQRKRIDEAKFLIKLGRLSITEIGLQVGFSSYNYFCKVFKELTGITATEYKSRNQTKNEAHA